MKYLLTIFLCITPFISTYAQESSNPEKKIRFSEFELIVTGIEEVKGELRIALFESEKNYKEKKDPLYAVVVPVENDTVKWNAQNLPFGNYAIAVYHDKNLNGELDTNLLRIPKEAYGFSNNARGRFGPASWEDAKFEIGSLEANHIIQIK